MRRPTTAPLVLAGWTLLVWAGRIRNAISGDEGAGTVVLAATFVALGGAVLASRGRSGPLVLALAAWTAAVWAVRIVDIAAFSERSAGFVAVHAVLAAVSIALAWWAVRRVVDDAAGEPAIR